VKNKDYAFNLAHAVHFA